MRRYDNNLVESRDGKWFSADEVIAEITRLQQRIAQLKAVNFMHVYGGSPTKRSALQIGEAMHASAQASDYFKKSAFNLDYAKLERHVANIGEADIMFCDGSVVDFKAPKL